jgi:hypothetical protein
MFTKIIIFIICFVAGIFCITKRQRLVFSFGHISWAEKYLGRAGTYTFWVLAGMGLMIFGLAYLLGIFDKIL